ncbi:MAG: hypothetical protein IJ909_01955 [Fibrobacter sp.]|nr:hypothetical protein [Fibrobacter sp.]
MNRKRLVKQPCGFITAAFAIGVLQVAASALDEAKVFDWWDNGIVTAEEATEILDLLEEGNQEEACLLAQVYAQESCEDPPSRVAQPKSPRRRDKTPKGKVPTRPSLAPHGFVDWKGRIDSAGHLESHRTELQVQFYRYTLRLGSQELLTYKNQGSEAYFGDISTRELHSQIPLDTLWGTSLLYPLGPFHVAGLLDTAKTTQVRLGYGQRGTGSAEIFYWHGFGNGDVQATEIHSLGLQAKTPFAQVAAWWQYGQEFPLIKILLYGSENTSHPVVFSWRTTAYIHRQDIPRWARLSSTIQKSKYWGSQSLSMRAPDLLNTKVTANAGLISPLDADTMAVRLKLGGESGPEFLRAAASVTCRDAGTNCRVTDWKGGLNASPWEFWVLGASVRVRHARPEGFAPPHLELSNLFRDLSKNYTKFTLIAPKGRPQEDLRLRTEFLISGDFLDFSLVCTFKGMERLEPIPVRGFAEAKVRF